MTEIAHTRNHTTRELFVVQDDEHGIQVFELETKQGEPIENLASLTPETAQQLIVSEEAKLEDIPGEVHKLRKQGLRMGLIFSGIVAPIYIASEKPEVTTALEAVPAFAVMGGIVYFFAGELRAQQYNLVAKKDNAQIGQRIAMLKKHTKPAVREEAK